MHRVTVIKNKRSHEIEGELEGYMAGFREEKGREQCNINYNLKVKKEKRKR